jgi:hypothetical protein
LYISYTLSLSLVPSHFRYLLDISLISRVTRRVLHVIRTVYPSGKPDVISGIGCYACCWSIVFCVCSRWLLFYLCLIFRFDQCGCLFILIYDFVLITSWYLLYLLLYSLRSIVFASVFFFELCWQCSVSCCAFYYVNPLGNRIFIDIIVALYLFVCKMSV